MFSKKTWVMQSLIPLLAALLLPACIGPAVDLGEKGKNVKIEHALPEDTKGNYEEVKTFKCSQGANGHTYADNIKGCENYFRNHAAQAGANLVVVEPAKNGVDNLWGKNCGHCVEQTGVAYKLKASAHKKEEVKNPAGEPITPVAAEEPKKENEKKDDNAAAEGAGVGAATGAISGAAGAGANAGNANAANPPSGGNTGPANPSTTGNNEPSAPSQNARQPSSNSQSPKKPNRPQQPGSNANAPQNPVTNGLPTNGVAK